MTYSIDLDWKNINIDLNTVNAWLKANAGTNYAGLSADSQLHVWFTDEPPQDFISAVQNYWNSLDEKSAEATNYKSSADRKADVENKAISAKTKLKALGLTDDEISALLG